MRRRQFLRIFSASSSFQSWITTLMRYALLLAQGETYDRLRQRAFPLLMTEPDRMPDHGFSGPELPCNDDVRLRFFGEI
jgi:hypothetical protein